MVKSNHLDKRNWPKLDLKQMTDIQSLLAIAADQITNSKLGDLTPLSVPQKEQIERLQQLLAQINLPSTKQSKELIKLLVKNPVAITNVQLTSNQLVVTVPNVSAEPISIELLPQTNQLISTRAELSLTKDLLSLHLKLPQQEAKLPSKIMLQLLDIATGKPVNAQNQLVLAAKIQHSNENIIAKANSLPLSINLPKTLNQLVIHNQTAQIEISEHKQQLKLAIKLDKNTNSIFQHSLPIKKAAELLLQQPLNLKLDSSAKQTKLKVNSYRLPLPVKFDFNSSQNSNAKVKYLGDKAILRIPSSTIELPVISPINKKVPIIAAVLTQAKPTSDTLAPIQKIAEAKTSITEQVLKPFFQSLKNYLVDKQVVTIKHVTQGKLVLSTPQQGSNNHEDKTLNISVNKTDTAKLSKIQQHSMAVPVYSRPTVSKTEQPNVTPTTNLLKLNLATLNTHLVKLNLDNPLIEKLKPLQQVTKQLPEQLNQLINRAFERLINEKNVTEASSLQIKSVIKPQTLKTSDQLTTPLGILQHSAITAAATGLAQQNRLPKEQQGKLENLLPLLFSLSKNFNDKQLRKTNKGQVTLPNLLQTRLAQGLNQAQTALQTSSNTSSQSISASNTENSITSFQFSLPILNEQKLSTTPISIQEEKKKNKQGEVISIWRINLVFSINDKPMLVNAELNKKQLGLSFEASSEDTINKAKTVAPLLTEKIESHGIKLTHMEYNVDSSLSTSPHQTGIINIKI